MIAGVKNKVAFKALGPDGLGIDVKGELEDGSHQSITKFSSSHLGMGYFFITPKENDTYTAHLTFADGSQSNEQISKVNFNAVTMAVINADDVYKIDVKCDKPWLQQNKGKVYTLIVYCAGMPVSLSFKLDRQEIGLNVLKDKLPCGIARATLFSADAEPLCERVFFVKPNNLLSLNLVADKAVYKTRSKISFRLKAGKVTGEPAYGQFSVAVTDESKVPVDESSEQTIVNNLLLTSELKGYIEQPNYYFLNTNTKTDADLDLVMLTHGYRKFEWRQVFAGKTPVKYPYEKGLSISGQLGFKNKPLSRGKIKLFSKAAGGLLLDTLSDANGRFVFDNLTFDDTTKLILQARTATGVKEVEIKPDSLPLPPPVNLPKQEVAEETEQTHLSVYERTDKLFLDEQDKYVVGKKAIALKEVLVKDQKIRVINSTANLNGTGKADHIITAAELENSGYTRLYDALRAKSGPDMIFTKDHRIRSSRTVVSFTNDHPPDYMLVIVDGTPLFNEDNNDKIRGMAFGVLDGIETADIEMVEILLGVQGGAIYGTMGAGGVIVVTTKKARRMDGYYKEAPGVLVYKANGFYKARKFYSPAYDRPANTVRPDMRTTIYWNPKLQTDNDGNLSFDYYNADGTGNYRVVIEGIDSDGNLGRKVYRYVVN